MRHSATRTCAALLVLAGTAGCGADVPFDPRIGSDCQHVTLAVSAEPVPQFTWAPACRMSHLEVGNVHQSELMWHLTADSTIQSGVRYGRRPVGAVTVTAARPLLPGVEYFVRVGRLRVGTTPVEYNDVGVGTFVP